MRSFRYQLTFLLAFVSGILSAQSLSVGKFQLLDNDLTANTRGTMKYDQNGEVAALIKVVTTETDFNFDVGSMGIVGTTQQKGEIWLYVPGGVQRITISHSKLGVLRNYYFPIPIEKGRTYELLLTSSRVRTIIEDEVTAQYVVFKVTPQNAIVTIDNMPYGLQPDGTVSQLLSYGKHSYRVDAPGFVSENGDVEVGSDRIILEVALKSSKGTVTLDCSMKEAEIYLNGTFVGTGSWTSQLDAAMYQVEVKREGHTSRTTSFTLQPQDEKTITLPVPQPIYGTVSITSQPIGATVYIDGEEIGTTPLLKGQILTGKRKLEFRMKDYQTVTMDVDIKEGQLNSFSTDLSDVLVAIIRTQPTGATLNVDGKNLGETPYLFKTTSGDYLISLNKTGYSIYKKKIHLDAGNPELNIELQRKSLFKNNYYAEISYQTDPASGIKVNAGLFLSNINFEIGALAPFGSSTTIWWINNASSWSGNPGYEVEYSLLNSITTYFGYGLLLSNRFRLTPRAGFIFNEIIGEYSDLGGLSNEETYIVYGSAGVRAEYSPVSHLGIVLTPSYNMPIKMGSLAEQLDSFSNSIKDWCNGILLNVGIEFYF